MNAGNVIVSCYSQELCQTVATWLRFWHLLDRFLISLMGFVASGCCKTPIRGLKNRNRDIKTALLEGPLYMYLFWKHLHTNVIGLFRHHEKFRKQLHVQRKKQEITFHVKMQRLNHVTLKKYKSYSRCTKYIYKYHDSHYKNLFKHFSGFSRSKCVF